tara:strand:+ start:1412 stop:1597 length:186 start_codon:yes stop_codon:yes gene_type:complete
MSENLNNEIERLTLDKQTTDFKIYQLKEELKKLKKSSDMLTGAIQTCHFLLQNSENKKEKS